MTFQLRDYQHMSETATRAKRLGEVFYFTGRPCKRGHVSPRYASSNNCRDCVAHLRGKAEMSFAKKPNRSKENQQRAMEAANNGETTYIPSNSCKNGHRLRSVSTNNCIQCDADSQLRARKNKKWARVQKEYGITKEAFDAMLLHQKSECAICRTPLSEKNTHIDHCHQSNIVRGLLCSKCNQGIGLLQEDKAIFLSAMKYLGIG